MADNQQQATGQATPQLRVGSPSSQLKMKFGTLSGQKTFSFNYANDSADIVDVKALGAAMIANGDIYQYPPLVLNEAWVEIKTINEYDLNT